MKLREIMREADQLQGKDETSTVHLVMTGYVAVNTDGVATTLQRDGSDYSASILGRLLKATAINIWTDVDGVLSADPRRVPQAHVIPEVSYNEAMELAYFGAKVRILDSPFAGLIKVLPSCLSELSSGMNLPFLLILLTFIIIKSLFI
jgi:aspartate kinase